MTSSKDSMLRALKFICGVDGNVCRLCLCSVEEEAVCMDDIIMTLEQPYCEETVKFYDLFAELGVSICL